MSVHLPTARTTRVSRPFAPNIENIRRIIDIADENPRLHDLRDTVRVIVNTGISIGELANLRWSDVDRESGRARVGTPSNYRRGRSIPLGLLTLQALAALDARHQQADYILSESFRRSSRMSRLLRAAAKRIGAGPVSLHSLRRAFAYRLVGNGVPISAIKYCLGHRNHQRDAEICLSPEQHCEQVAHHWAQFGEL